MTQKELSTTLRVMNEFYDSEGESLYQSGKLDGVRELLDRLDYEYPPLDYLGSPGAKIVKRH